MIGNVIQSQFLSARDWPFGAVFAVFVVVLMMAVLLIQSQVLRRSQEVPQGA